MDYDFNMGFMKKPLNLTEILKEQGFKLHSTKKSGNFETRHYFWFDAQKSQRGVHINYMDGICGDEKLLQLDPNLVSWAVVTTDTGTNDFDKLKQKNIVIFLKEHYLAILYDPQKHKEIF